MKMPTGRKYQQSPRAITSSSTARHSCSWVMLKTQHMLTLNSSDAVTTTSIIMGGSLVICQLEEKPPTEEQSKKVYTQEYQEVVAQIENSLDLME